MYDGWIHAVYVWILGGVSSFPNCHFYFTLDLVQIQESLGHHVDG